MTSEAAGKKKPKIPGSVEIERELCKGCSFCVEYCPPKCLELDKAFNAKGYHPPILARADECTGCDLCGLYCPDFAIFGFRLDKKKAA